MCTARPDSRYGVSKVFGEAVGALYADKHGLGVTCLRIGNFGDKPLDHRRLSIWLKPEDLVQLCRIGLDHPDIHFEIFYGASYNERAWWDNHRAYELGYRPTGRGGGFPRARLCRAGQAASPIRSAISTRAARSAAWSSTATRAGSSTGNRFGRHSGSAAKRRTRNLEIPVVPAKTHVPE